MIFIKLYTTLSEQKSPFKMDINWFKLCVEMIPKLHRYFALMDDSKVDMLNGVLHSVLSGFILFLLCDSSEEKIEKRVFSVQSFP